MHNFGVFELTIRKLIPLIMDYNLDKKNKYIIPLLLCITFSFHSFAQQTTIRGKVQSSEGEPLNGVNILVKKKNIGTTTDFDGIYTLNNVISNDVITYSFLGYKTQEVSYKGQSIINITLEETSEQLDELVLVGYGKLRKGEVTGSYSTISEESLQQGSVLSIEEAIQGKIAGVNVVNTSAEPGGAISINIRGITSIAGNNQPLFVIDGIPFLNDSSIRASEFESNVQTNVLSIINPDDVVSVKILKDADATAIYGSRGANGVILITTRQGSVRKAKVSIQHHTTFSSKPKTIPLASAQDYAIFINKARENAGQDLLYTGQSFQNSTGLDSIYFPTPGEIPALLGKGTNWQKEIFQSTVSQNTQFNINGGSETFQYNVSGNYTDQEGSLLNSNYKRGAIRGNFNIDIGPKFSIISNTMLSKSRNDRVENANHRGAGGGYERAGIIWKAFHTSPIIEVADAFFSEDFGNDVSPFNLFNPVVDILNTLNTSEDLFMLSNLQLDYQFFDDLSLTVRAGTTQFYNQRSLFWNKNTALGNIFNNKSRYATSFNSSYVNENYLTYKKKLNKHKITAVLGGSWERNRRKSSLIGAQNFSINVNNGLYLFDYAEALDPAKPSLNFIESELLSGYFRANYSFNNKYALSITGRADGSSKFAKNKKWAFFPSVGLAWNFTKEKFLSNQNLIKNGKLRASYGTSGNQAISPYQSLPSLGILTFGFVNSAVNGVVLGNPGNTELTWETTKQYDFGLEFALINNKLKFNIDYYNKETNDLLQRLNVPSESGFTTFLTNFGTIENSGIEVELSAQLIQNKNINWSVDANYSANRNKIIDLGELDFLDFGLPGNVEGATHRLKEGGSIGDFYVFQTNGLLTSEDIQNGYPTLGSNQSEGQIKFIDKNEDGIINDNDKIIRGNAYPKHIIGLSSNFRYKNFSFNMFWNAALGQKVLNLNRQLSTVGHPFGVPSQDYINDFWSPDNTNAFFPVPSSLNEINRVLDRFLEDGSYVRLKTATVEYNLDVDHINAFDELAISITGNNILTFTKYKGYDPEVSAFGQTSLTPGIDKGSFPRTWSLSLGISIGL